jgi:hypothetical protein
MLVSVDAQKGQVTVYGKTIVTVPISHAAKLRALLSGKTVQYVTEVEEVSGEEVLDLVAGLSSHPAVDQSAWPTTQGDGRLWLHATGSGYLNLPNPVLIFKGKMDFKSLDDLGHDLPERFPVIQSLIDQGKLAVVDTAEKLRLTRVAHEQAMAFEERKSLNSDGTDIMVDTYGGKMRANPNAMKDFFEVDSQQPSEDFMSEDAKVALQMGWGKADEAEVEAP